MSIKFVLLLVYNYTRKAHIEIDITKTITWGYELAGCSSDLLELSRPH